MRVELGVVRGLDFTAGTAAVDLLGSGLQVPGVPLARHVVSGEASTGQRCLVAIPEDGNTANLLVVAVYRS